MQKSVQANDRIKLNQDNFQTEELIADSRSILTPSQRVDAKLAACSASSSRTFRGGFERFSRRPK